MAEEPITVVVDQGGNAEPANHLYVWVVVHSPGDESIMSIGNMPMMGAKYATARKLRPKVALTLRAIGGGKTAKLIRYDAAETLEEISGS